MLTGLAAPVIDQLSEFQGITPVKEDRRSSRPPSLRLVLRHLLKDSQEGHEIRLLLLRQIQLLNQVEELHRVLERQ
jgi:hypothetical protein